MSPNSLPINLLSDESLQLLASGMTDVNTHVDRRGLLGQITAHLREKELCPTFTQSTFNQLPVALFGFSVVLYRGDIYVYGGRASSDTNLAIDTHFYYYSQKQQKWHVVTQYHPPLPRRWHTSMVHGDAMYVYGGQAWNDSTAEWEPCSTINRYDFSTSTWDTIEQHGCSPSAKTKRCATAVGASLYVLAVGQHGSSSYSMLHRFDLDSCCWSMQSCTGDASAADVPDGQLFVLEQLLHHQGNLLVVFSTNPTTAGANSQQDLHQTSGHTANSKSRPSSGQPALSLYSLSLTTCKWSHLSTEGEAPANRTQSCIALLDELLIVSGGTRGAETPLLADLAFLHIPSRKWHLLQLQANCQPARACHAAAVVGDGTVYLMGGWHDGWPAPAPGLVLQRKYVCREQASSPTQQHSQGSPESADMARDSCSSRSRPVLNTELRASLLKAASSSNRGTGVALPLCSTDSGSNTHISFNRCMPYCDVTLTAADGVNYQAHRFILASQSPVLEAMLGSANMSEASTGMVTLPDISSPVLEALLAYLYGGLPAGIPQELVLELFTAADRFLLPGLAAECILLLLGCLTWENVSLVADLANTHRLTELWQACVVFAAAPGAQLEVFNSTAYAQLWKDSASVAQAFTTQAVAFSQRAAACTKQQASSSAAVPEELAAQMCILPPLQPTATGATGVAMLPGKRQRLD